MAKRSRRKKREKGKAEEALGTEAESIEQPSTSDTPGSEVSDDEKRKTQQIDISQVQKEIKKRKRKAADKEVELISIQRRGESEKKEGRKVIVDKPYVGLVSLVNGKLKEKSNNGWERETGSVQVLEPVEADYQLRYKRGKREGCFHGFILHKTRLPSDEYNFLRRVVLEREKIKAITDIATTVVKNAGFTTNPKMIGSTMELAMRLDHQAVDLEQELNFPQKEAEEIAGIYSSGDYSITLYLECLKIAGGLEGSRTVLEEAEEVFSRTLKDEKPDSDSLRLAEEFRREVLRYRELNYGQRSENMQLFGIEYGKKSRVKRKVSEKRRERESERSVRAWENTKNRIRKKIRERGHTTQVIRAADLLPSVLRAAKEREKTERLKVVKPEVKVYPIPSKIRTIPEEPTPDEVRVITLPREGFFESVVVWEGEVKRLFSRRERNGFRLAAPAVVGSSLRLMKVLPGREKILGKKGEEEVDGSVGLTFEGPVESVDFISLDDFLLLERYYVAGCVQRGIEECYGFYNEAIDRISREPVEKSVLTPYTDAQGRTRLKDIDLKMNNPIRAYRTSIGDRVRSEALATIAGITISRGEERRANAIRKKYQNAPGLGVLIDSLKREGMVIGYQKFLDTLTSYENVLGAFSTFHGQQQGKQLEILNALFDDFFGRFELTSHKGLISKILSSAKEQWTLTTMAFSLTKAVETLEKVLEESYKVHENPVNEYLTRHAPEYVCEAVSPEEAEYEARRLSLRLQSSAIGYASLGEILMEREDFEGAKDCFEQTIVINDCDPLLYQRLGDCYFEIGNRARRKKDKAKNWATAFEAYVVTSSLIKEEADRLYKLAEVKEAEAEQLKAGGKDEEGEKVYGEAKDHRKSGEGKYSSRKDIEELLRGMAGSFGPDLGCKFFDYQPWIKLGDFYTESEDWEGVAWAYINARPLVSESAKRLFEIAREKNALGSDEEAQGREGQAQRYFIESGYTQKEAEHEAELGKELEGRILEAKRKAYQMKRQIAG